MCGRRDWAIATALANFVELLSKAKRSVSNEEEIREVQDDTLYEDVLYTRVVIGVESCSKWQSRGGCIEGPLNLALPSWLQLLRLLGPGINCCG